MVLGPVESRRDTSIHSDIVSVPHSARPICMVIFHYGLDVGSHDGCCAMHD